MAYSSSSPVSMSSTLIVQPRPMPALGLFALVDDDGVRQNVLYLGDAAIELGLLVFRLVIFAVFREVAERTGLFDLLGDFLFARRFQIVQFLLQLLEAERADFEFFCHNSRSFLSSSPEKRGRMFLKRQLPL